jgi:hypothetical protein
VCLVMFEELRRAPTDVDHLTFVVRQGGGRVYVLAEEDEEARRVAHRRAFQQRQAEMQAEQAHAERVRARAVDYMANGLGDVAVDVTGLTPARMALMRHIQWLAHAAGMQAVARVRAAEVASVANRHDAAAAAIAALDQEVAAAHLDWIRFGSMQDAPDARSAEREGHRLEAAEAALVAALRDEVGFELAVANAVVCHLEEQLPRLRNDVLIESTGPVLAEIRDHAVRLSILYGELCALRSITDKKELPDAGWVKLPPTGAPVKLTWPARSQGEGFDVSATEADIAAWRQALADIEANPSAEVRLPNMHVEATPKPTPLRIAGFRRFFGDK